MKLFCGLLLVALLSLAQSRQIEFTNRCGYDIWINPLTNAEGPPLAGGIARLSNHAQFTYQIPDSGW